MNARSLPSIAVEPGDALAFPCDVLVLKYAQAPYGVDAAVANELAPIHPQAKMAPAPGESVLLPTQGAIAARNVLVIGVAELRHFDYDEIRQFGYAAMQLLSQLAPDATRVAMTMHGAGYGLDEREAFLTQMAGVMDAIRDGFCSAAMKSLTIVERGEGRAQRLQGFLAEVLAASRARVRDSRTFTFIQDKFVVRAPAAEAGTAGRAPAAAVDRAPAPAAGRTSAQKPHIFVAMPFAEGEFEDVFGFGIQGPVNKAGYLCERVDMSVFIGDIMERVRERIETAELVIADLTGANPNVYLEVGFAWGRDRRVLLLVKDGFDLKFDVRGQRSIKYKNITDLSQKLAKDLAELLPRAAA